MECAISAAELGLLSLILEGPMWAWEALMVRSSELHAQRHARLAALEVTHVEKDSIPLDTETFREGQRAEADTGGCL